MSASGAENWPKSVPFAAGVLTFGLPPTSRCRVCVIAGNISPMDVISHLPVLCEDNDVPYIYVRSKEDLGAAGLTKRCISSTCAATGRARIRATCLHLISSASPAATGVLLSFSCSCRPTSCMLVAPGIKKGVEEPEGFSEAEKKVKKAQLSY